MQAIQRKLWLLSIEYASQAWKLKNNLLQMPTELWHRTSDPAPVLYELIGNPVYQPALQRRPKGLLAKSFLPLYRSDISSDGHKETDRSAPPPSIHL